MSLETLLTSSWQKRSCLPTLLWPLSALHGAAVRTRRWAYDQGWLKSTRLPCPVLVVGNRIAGGAGKTPTTIAILEHLLAMGWHPGVLTRGYKATSDQHPRPLLLDENSETRLTAESTGDEPLLIWRRTGVPVMIDPSRVRGGLALLSQRPEVDILVCDDGLQHLALARDIEVVVFDQRGQGNGWLLPSGPLREPIDVHPVGRLVAAPITLYNADHISTPIPGHLARRSVAPLIPLEDWWSCPGDTISHRSFRPPESEASAVWALAGIAQPDRFFEQLRGQGWKIHGVALPDHALMDPLPWPRDVSDVIVTEKDAVKLSPDLVRRERPHTTVWVSSLNFSPDNGFWDELDQALTRLPSAPR